MDLLTLFTFLIYGSLFSVPVLLTLIFWKLCSINVSTKQQGYDDIVKTQSLLGRIDTIKEILTYIHDQNIDKETPIEDNNLYMIGKEYLNTDLQDVELEQTAGIGIDSIVQNMHDAIPSPVARAELSKEPVIEPTVEESNIVAPNIASVVTEVETSRTDDGKLEINEKKAPHNKVSFNQKEYDTIIEIYADWYQRKEDGEKTNQTKLQKELNKALGRSHGIKTYRRVWSGELGPEE